MVEDTVCTIGVYGGRQPSIYVNNHLVYGRILDPGTQPDIIADVPKNQLVANLNPASDGNTDNPRLPLELFAAWLANGDVDISSLAIVQRLTGITMTVNGTREHGCEDTPKDPGDLRRILGMFDMVPSARAYLSLMRDVSEDWKTIIDHWDELEKTVSERGTQSIRLRPQNLPDTETIEGRKPCLTKTSKPNHGS